MSKIITLLSLAIDESVCLKNIVAFSSTISTKYSGNDKIMPHEISLYFESHPFTKRKPKIDPHNMLFQFPRNIANAKSIIKNWIDAYDKIEPTLDLFFSTRTDAYKYLESRFLALVQGLETLHRRTSTETKMNEPEFLALVKTINDNCPKEHQEWLTGRLKYGNELSLSVRLRRLFQPFKTYFGTYEEREKTITTIVNTRNYFTHWDENIESVAAKGYELILICNKMEALLQFHFLKLIGLTQDETKSIYYNSRSLRHKLKTTLKESLGS